MGSSNTSFYLTNSLQNSIIVRKKGGFMEARYYNIYEFNKAMNNQYDNPYESKMMYEEYFNKYPNDYASYPYFVSLLISLGEIEYAKEIYELAEKKVIRDNKYRTDKDKYHYFEYGMFTCKLKILFQEEKYQDVLSLYYRDIHKFQNAEFNNVCFYCLEKLGKLDKAKRDMNSYLFRQIVEYKEEDFRNHIEKHMLLPDKENDNESIFTEEFPIDKVIEEIRKCIPSDKRILSGYLTDYYYFKYNDCGKYQFKYTDYFEVVCFHDTGDIITMYPTNNCENMPYIDLNYLKKEDKIMVKELSQIDKFKMRYSKK